MGANIENCSFVLYIIYNGTVTVNMEMESLVRKHLVLVPFFSVYFISITYFLFTNFPELFVRLLHLLN